MKILRPTLLALGMTAFAAASHAQIVVMGKGDAALCYDYTLRGNSGSQSAIDTCSDALKEHLTQQDQAATLVNRGILQMRKGNQKAASADYDAAIAIQPDLTEAYVNYGASLIRQKKFDEALVALNTALEDTESSTRPEALYNRAVVMDQTEQFMAAYRDAKAALALRPDWQPALDLIDRYEIKPAG